jgi:hypothetical protein
VRSALLSRPPIIECLPNAGEHRVLDERLVTADANILSIPQHPVLNVWDRRTAEEGDVVNEMSPWNLPFG